MPAPVGFVATVTIVVILLSACGGSSDENEETGSGVTATPANVLPARLDGDEGVTLFGDVLIVMVSCSWSWCRW